MEEPKVIDPIQTFYEEHLDDMIQKHSKVLQIRFDLRYPNNDNIEVNPKQIRDFSEYFIRDNKRNHPFPKEGQRRNPGRAAEKTHNVDPVFMSAQEQHNDSSHPHYHCLALVNGHAKQNSYDIHKRAERQWANALGLENANGLVDFCDKQGDSSIMIHRNQGDFPDQLKAAKQQASYLAKARGKEPFGNKPCRFGGTRLPKEKK
jgi:hypothetical protein